MRCEMEYGMMRNGACCDGRRSAVCEMGERRGALGRKGWSVMGAVVDDAGCGAWGKEKAQAMSLGLMVDGVSGSVGFLTSSSCHPKIFIKEFSYFLMSCHQHCLGVNLLVQR